MGGLWVEIRVLVDSAHWSVRVAVLIGAVSHRKTCIFRYRYEILVIRNILTRHAVNRKWMHHNTRNVLRRAT